MTTPKMEARNFSPRCVGFFIRIPMESLKIRDSNAMHLGKKFFATILGVIIDSVSTQSCEFNLSC